MYPRHVSNLYYPHINELSYEENKILQSTLVNNKLLVHTQAQHIVFKKFINNLSNIDSINTSTLDAT